jgi:hypothetical protein
MKIIAKIHDSEDKTAARPCGSKPISLSFLCIFMNRFQRIVQFSGLIATWYLPVVGNSQIIDSTAAKILDSPTTEIIAEDPCAKDTTLVFRQGTRVTLNRCEYLNLRSCFRVHEFILDTTLQKGEITTLGDERKPLYSAGIVKLKFCNDCLEKPAIVQIPANKLCAPGRMSLWTGTGDDDWVPDKPSQVKNVRIGGVDYFEFKVRCSGTKNVAMIASVADEVKFVIRDNELELTEIRISYGCPNVLIKSERSRGAKEIKMSLPCPSGEPMIFAKAVSEAGDTLIMHYQPLNDLTRSGPINNCRPVLKEDRKKKDKNVLYQKYVLFRRDFENAATVKAE